MEEEFETGLPKVAKEECLMGEINLKNLLAGEAQSFSFDLPEEVKTPGFNKESNGAPSPQKILNRETYEQMELKFLASTNADTMKVMFGDYTEIEAIMEDVPGEDGRLKKKLLRPGTGKKVVEQDMVVVHFLLGGEWMDELIESTFSEDRPFRFRVGAGQALHAIDIGVRTMRVGEIAKFLAVCEYGYGKLGLPSLNGGSRVPPNTRVMVQIEVLECYVSDKDESISRMSSADRAELPFEKLLSFAETTKMDGNREFKANEYQRAITRYLEALDVVRDMTPMSNDEKEDYFRIRMQLCTNLAHAYFKTKKFKRALKFAEDGTEIPMNGHLKGKSLYWYAKCLFELGRYEQCLENVTKAETMLIQQDSDIKCLKVQAKRKVKAAEEKEKLVCARMMAAKIS